MIPLTKALTFARMLRPGTRLVEPSLKQCQLDTPDEVIRFVWTRIKARRSSVEDVLDVGAGDGRFSKHGDYDRYVGYEIDAKRLRKFSTTSCRVIHADALHARGLFDVVIGNPPYIRNQDLRDSWRRRAVKLIEEEAAIEVDLRANLYVYFMWLALLRTKSDGLVAQIVPTDWLVRPSTRRIREYITTKSWGVSAYVFDDAKQFFPGVKTNLTLTIIDKQAKGPWDFFSVTKNLKIISAAKRAGLAEALKPFPVHERRTSGIRAGRGLSPGAQKVFVLTEEERKKNGIARSSVDPCVTSLRALPRSLRSLSEASFNKHFVEAGRRCWLLKTDQPKLAKPVTQWLDAAPETVRQNGTCGRRDPWYSFEAPLAPDVLYSSGFSASPLFIVNTVGAKAAGSVHGIFGAAKPSSVVKKLRSIDYASARFRHARHLMKIEVSQMNDLLMRLFPASLAKRR